jgi:hypothetical protein
MENCVEYVYEDKAKGVTKNVIVNKDSAGFITDVEHTTFAFDKNPKVRFKTEEELLYPLPFPPPSNIRPYSVE